MPEPQEKDPITGTSFSTPLLWTSFLLMLTLAWALYDEMIGLRPWRGYQSRFATAYSAFLEKQIPLAQEKEARIRNSSEFKKLEEQQKAAEDAARARVQQIDEETRFLDQRLAALTAPFQEQRARVTSLVYQAEIAGSESSRKSRLEDVEEARKNTVGLELPSADGKTEKVKWDFDQMEREFNRIKAEKARLVTDRASALARTTEIRQVRDTFLKDNLGGLSATQLSGLLKAVRGMKTEIRQINVDKAGLVDRCQSCHVGTDPKFVPTALTVSDADLGIAENSHAPFASHPNPTLLSIHPTDRFGCSPCHGGNGRATSSPVKGHGRHKYWLWPLFYRENVEAGCQTCHSQDAYTLQASVLNRGKELYRQKGCIGCHRFEGFDNQGEALLAAVQNIRQLRQQRKDMELEIPRIVTSADKAADNATAQRLYAQADALKVDTSLIDARVEELQRRSANLMREEKRIGPNLKEVRMKLVKEFIPYWLEHTHEFSPTTDMPQFRLGKNEIQAISAFIWQSGFISPVLPQVKPGNPARGKQLFESRGCLACHAVGQGKDRVGADFAANLTRAGEKNNYNYLVRWIFNPRLRTRPYDPVTKKDLGPEDYAKHGKPFVFDFDHDLSPDGKNRIQVINQTVMPILRLSPDDAADVASYIMTLKKSGASFPPAPFMDDPKLKETGRALIKNYGCASCHEISTLEDESRVGTELTTEGSKPIERLDFALLTEHAKRGILPDGKKSPRGSWYDVKGFFEEKLANPAVFDQNKHKPNPLERLKMPKPNVTTDDITALTTVLVGSTDPQVPREYLYRPANSPKDVQEGFWLVTKYNCMGCHQIVPGQKPHIQELPMYQSENKDKVPPPLMSEGARVDPNWLARFLANPAMSTTETNRNGVRTYLEVRMPTFQFTDDEIRKIVRFFESISSQERPYMPPRVTPLTDTERSIARALFTSQAAPCLKCHATGQPAHDATATAPNFLLARDRLRPAWTMRWITDPARIAPGTAMPSGLFRLDGDRWIFNGPLPAVAQQFHGDQADLLVRYMFSITPEEQRMLLGRSPSSTSSVTTPRKDAARAPSPSGGTRTGGSNP